MWKMIGRWLARIVLSAVAEEMQKRVAKRVTAAEDLQGEADALIRKAALKKAEADVLSREAAQWTKMHPIDAFTRKLPDDSGTDA